jgi:hypothetical protein
MKQAVGPFSVYELRSAGAGVTIFGEKDALRIYQS